jgi:hypothetical protein
MASLAEIYQSVVQVEQQQIQKIAEANDGFEIEKVASHYDELGRAMARAYVSDMIKSAVDEAEGDEGAEAAAAEDEEGEEAEIARRKAEIMAKLKAAQAEEEGAGAAPEAAQMV